MNATNTLSKDALNKLEKVVDINKDAVEFYEKAKQEVESADLRQTFNRMSETHQNILNRLDTLLQQADASRSRADASETVVGTANRLFGQLLSSISSKPDEALIKRLEEAEDRCLHSLQDLLKEESIDPQTRQTLEQELKKTQESHDHMRELKKHAAA